MDKRNSSIFLGIVLIGMIALGILVLEKNKNEIFIEDISGDRNNLNKVQIIYQKRKGLYETDQIKIMKDHEEIDMFVKDGINGFDLTKENIKNREMYSYLSLKSHVFENDNEIGTVNFIGSYTGDANDNMIAEIRIKDKKTNTIKTYQFVVNDKVNSSGNTMYAYLPIRDGDNIYLAVISSVYSEGYNDDNYEDTSSVVEDYYTDTYLNLYKFNLSSNQYKHIATKYYSGNKMNIDFSSGFVRGDTAYFIVNKKEDNDKDFKTVLFGFDVISKDISILDLGIKNYYVSDININDNEVLVSCLSGSNFEKIMTVLVNLDNYKVVRKNEINIKNNDSYESNIICIEREKNKTYLLVGDYNYNSNVYSEYVYPDSKYYIYVIDEKNNKIIYKGRIKEEIPCDLKFGILGEDDL